MLKLPKRRYLVLVVVLVLGIAGWFIATGGMPLEDGRKLADGRITMAVDDFMAAYVVEVASGGLILIDATMDPDAAAINRAIADLGKSPQDVIGIFLTHGHGDHIAGALSFPHARVFALEADADLVAGRRSAQNLIGKSKTPKLTGISVTDSLSDREVIVIGGTTVTVFAIPGHTLGSTAYLVHGVLFLGDSAAATSAGTLGGAPLVFSADRDQAHKSLIRLAHQIENSDRYRVDTLAFGHQGPLQGLAPLLEWAAQ